jgi:hypothetical protein
MGVKGNYWGASYGLGGRRARAHPRMPNPIQDWGSRHPICLLRHEAVSREPGRVVRSRFTDPESLDLGAIHGPVACAPIPRHIPPGCRAIPGRLRRTGPFEQAQPDAPAFAVPAPGTPAAAVAVTNLWSFKAPMATGRQSPGAGVVNGVIYVVGGYNGGSDAQQHGGLYAGHQ